MRRAQPRSTRSWRASKPAAAAWTSPDEPRLAPLPDARAVAARGLQRRRRLDQGRWRRGRCRAGLSGLPRARRGCGPDRCRYRPGYFSDATERLAARRRRAPADPGHARADARPRRFHHRLLHEGQGLQPEALNTGSLFFYSAFRRKPGPIHQPLMPRINGSRLSPGGRFPLCLCGDFFWFSLSFVWSRGLSQPAPTRHLHSLVIELRALRNVLRAGLNQAPRQTASRPSPGAARSPEMRPYGLTTRSSDLPPPQPYRTKTSALRLRSIARRNARQPGKT